MLETQPANLTGQDQHTTRAGTIDRNKIDDPQRPRCVSTSKEPPTHQTQHLTGRGINISGVDFWHAVEFSRNGRFLQTPLRTLRALPSGTSYSRLYQKFRDRFSPICFPSDPRPAGPFPFAFPTLPEPFSPDSQPKWDCRPEPSRAVPTSEP